MKTLSSIAEQQQRWYDVTQFNTRIRSKTDTTENWQSQRTFVPLKGEVIIYSDYKSKLNDDGETVYIPAIKIGDGSTYGVDLPFVGEDLREKIMDHISNTGIHVTELEKLFWNNKINVTDTQEVVDNVLMINRN